MSVEAFVSIINALGIMALVTLAYGKLQRFSCPKWQRHLLAGGVFGAGAMVEMLDPTVLAPGMLIDNRTLFIAFAGVFLGPVGAASALIIGVTTRTILGGDGAAIGVVAMTIAALIGLAWTAPRVRPSRFRLVHLFLVGASVSLSLTTIAFLPEGARQLAVTQLVPWLVLFNIIGATVFGSLLESSRERARIERSLSEVAERDPLTHVHNRRGLSRAFGTLRERQRQSSIAVLMVDLDRFKRINDRWGHHVGDEVLCETARAIESTIREGDIVARSGGEEFAVLLPGATEDEAMELAERMRMAISEHVTPLPDRSFPVTASVGAAHFPELPEMVEALKAADLQLYAAKRGGRDIVSFNKVSSGPARPSRSSA